MGELDLVERIFFIRQGPIFGRASINALAEVSRAMSEVQFEAGTPLWSDGDPSGWLLLLVDGTIRCTLGRESFRFGPGMPPGGLESLAEWPRWYTAVTETPVRALHGHMETLLDVFEDNFEMASDYLAVVCKGLLDALERLAEPDDEAELQRLYGCDEEEVPPPR